MCSGVGMADELIYRER